MPVRLNPPTPSGKQPREQPDEPQREPLQPLAWAAGVLALGVLLHVDRAPLWVCAAALLFVMWRVAAAARRLWLPGGIIRAVTALVLVGAVFANFGTLNGLNAGTALLILMSSIKLLEARKRRDEYIVIGGALFLLLAACLDRQSLLRAPLYVAHAWLCCAGLAVVASTPREASQRPAFGARAALALAGRGLLYATPLAAALFVLFPRLPGAFWSLPRSGDAVTGLSDRMSPGSISELTSSYDIAFRAKFEGEAPPAQERYWRGPVLHEFDGFTWSGRADLYYRQQRLQYLGRSYRYHISLEPSQQRWWFALDTAVGAPPNSKVLFTYDYQLVASDPVTEPTDYDAVSHTATHATGPLSQVSRRADTALPANRNPRSVQLARDMRQRTGSDAQFVDSVLEMLRTGGFVYSLTPPRLGFHSVDDFLFSTRSGFCGHYASAFVTLMRAGGVPARVVTGYLGGEWNPIGGYFIIRQSDAHSWAEVWLEGRGWTRVDPTGVVEPERLRRGILDLLPNAVSAPARMVRASPWLTDLVQRWDAANAWWNDHVVKFDYHSQLDMLRSLGIDSPDSSQLGWAFATALLGWLGWIAWRIGRSRSGPPPDRLARAYARLCAKLSRVGLPRAPHQGPIAYADEISDRRPDLAGSVRMLLVRYAELRYGVAPTRSHAADVAGFERAVSRLSVRSQSE